MSIAHVRTETSSSGGNSTAASITLSSAPPSGRLLLAHVVGSTLDARTASAGWTKIQEGSSGTAYHGLYGKIAGASESATQTPCTTASARNYRTALSEFSGTFGSSVAAILNGSTVNDDNDATKTTTGAVNPDDGVERLAFGAAVCNHNGRTWSAHKLNGATTHNGAAVTERSDLQHSSGLIGGTTWTWIGTTVSGNYTAEAVESGSDDGSIILAIVKESIVTVSGSFSGALATLGGSFNAQQVAGGGTIVEATFGGAFALSGAAVPGVGADFLGVFTVSGSFVAEQAVSFAEGARVALRQALARRLGSLEIATVNAAAEGEDAARLVQADELIDLGKHANSYRGWVYFIRGTLAGRQRRILDGGFDGPSGTLSLARALPDVAQGGDQFEVHTLLPAEDADTLVGLNRLLNDALEGLWVIDRLPMTGDGTASYDLSAYPWLRLDEQVVGIEYTASAGLAPTPWGGGRRVRYDAESFTLDVEATVPSGQAFEVLVHRPAKTRIRSGGTWSDSTLGLGADSDEVAGDPRNVVEVAYYLALRQLIERLRSSQDVSRWIAELALQARVVQGIYDQVLPRAPRRRSGAVYSPMPKGMAW